MSDRDRGDRGALIALAMVVFAIVIISILEWSSEPLNKVVEQPHSAYIGTNQNEDVAQRVSGSNDFHPWRDTYAQWLMALLSVAATVVSIWAVRLLRRTLRETQKANKTARQAMLAQTRPWIKVVSGRFYSAWQPTTELEARVNCKIRNIGKSPALSVYASGEIFFSANKVGASDALRERAAIARDRPYDVEYTIFPDSDGGGEFPLVYPRDRPAAPVYVYAFLCVRYRIEGDKTVHQTSRLYKLEIYVPQAKKFFFEPLEVYKVMPADLEFRFSPANTAGDYAD